MLSTSANSGQLLHVTGVQHDLLLPPVTPVLQGILQEGEAGQLAGEAALVVAEGVANLARADVFHTLVSAVNAVPGQQRLLFLGVEG